MKKKIEKHIIHRLGTLATVYYHRYRIKIQAIDHIQHSVI